MINVQWRMEKMWYNEAKQIKFSRLITGKYFLFQMNGNEWKFRLFPQSLLNWNLSKVVDRNCGNCWSIFVLFWISPPMTLEDTIKFQEDPKIITILWKKTTWNMKTAPKMNNDIKREGNQNCKWSAVFTIRFPKKIDWDWQWQFHHFHFISFHFISFISAKLQPLMIYIQHITVSMNIGYASTGGSTAQVFLNVSGEYWSTRSW